MRSANIADLRNRLTQYLQEVRAGEEILVRDRQPIAKIVPFKVDEAEDASLVAAGLMRKGSGVLPPSFWNARRPRLTTRKVAAAVRADRDAD